jgi:nitrite reductase/ring-hydroxylating ferredoxin subunit/uncharacterized membrane protein
MMTEVESPSTQRGSEPTSPVMHEVAEWFARFGSLDAVAKPLAAAASLVGAGQIKDALSGTWLGHPLHPFLTDFPIGSWTCATVLDLAGGEESAPAAERLVGLGILAALPTALSGTTEWADSQRGNEAVRRIGVVHAGANVAALALFAASFLARRRGDQGRGKALTLAGMGALTLGGHLGGHLSYSKGVGVDETVFERRPTDWRPALADSALPDGGHEVVDVDNVSVLVTRQGGELYALANRCCHRGGPLGDGTIQADRVVCPWHGSTFALEDGSVIRGPAAYPQPVYDVQVRDNQIEVRARS